MNCIKVILCFMCMVCTAHAQEIVDAETAKYEQAKNIGEPRIKAWETCIFKPKRDTDGNWAIAYGNHYQPNGKPVTASTRITSKAEADLYFNATWDDILSQIRKDLPVERMRAEEIAAMASLFYNAGIFVLHTKKGRIIKDAFLEYLECRHDFLRKESLKTAWMSIRYANGKELEQLKDRRAGELAFFLNVPPVFEKMEIFIEPMTIARVRMTEPEKIIPLPIIIKI